MSCLEELNEALCRTLVASQAIRIVGPQEGYRNKMTYSFTDDMELSPLAMPAVNRIVRSVDAFRRLPRVNDAHLSDALPSNFWCEVCVKITRREEAMVKVTFSNATCPLGERSSSEGATAFDVWRCAGEGTRLVAFLAEHEPSVSVVVAHVAAATCDKRRRGDEDDEDEMPCQVGSSMSKPGKHDLYVPLKDDKTFVIEYTPNGVPYVLSPDSFCEVNHAMEDSIFNASVEFLQLSDAKPRRAFITGRDVNSVVKTFAQYYSAGVVAASTCPRVLADAENNGLSCRATTKDAVWKHLSTMRDSRCDAQQLHVLITAGRHGLHPSTVQELVRLGSEGAVDDVLYVSCNVESMMRDVFLFKQSFFLVQCRTFDFFPKTQYVMTVMHLRAIPAGRHKRVLVLPVGPPGSGKSTCGAFVTHALSTICTQDTRRAFFKHKKDMQKRTERGIVSIPRILDIHAPSRVACRVVERDRLFKDFRDGGVSLRDTRAALHAALIDACRGSEAADDTMNTSVSVTYLDSTNGSSEARALYASHFSAGCQASDTLVCECRSCVVLHFVVKPPDVFFVSPLHRYGASHGVAHDEDAAIELHRRCKNRVDHPAFPSDAEEQRSKIATIINALSNQASCEEENAAWAVASLAGNDDSVALTQVVVATVVWFHAFCSSALAEALLPEVPWNWLWRKWPSTRGLCVTTDDTRKV